MKPVDWVLLLLALLVLIGSVTLMVWPWDEYDYDYDYGYGPGYPGPTQVEPETEIVRYATAGEAFTMFGIGEMDLERVADDVTLALAEGGCEVVLLALDSDAVLDRKSVTDRYGHFRFEWSLELCGPNELELALEQQDPLLAGGIDQTQPVTRYPLDNGRTVYLAPATGDRGYVLFVHEPDVIGLMLRISIADLRPDLDLFERVTIEDWLRIQMYWLATSQ